MGITGITIDDVRVTNATFSEALDLLKKGMRAHRVGWNGQGMWIAVQWPAESSKMSRPYIFMKTVDDQLVPWVASQSDLLAEDWVVPLPVTDES